MTRINVIPPAELHNKHLLIEYRELPRIFGKAYQAHDIPAVYKLGTGHMKFFYNKLEYLVKRMDEIVKELKKRGYNLSYDAEGLRKLNRNPLLYNDWTPTEQAIRLNKIRLQASVDRSASIRNYNYL